MQLHQPAVLTRLDALDARLVVFSFAPLERLRAWLPHFQQNFLTPSYEESGMKVADPFARTAFVADSSLTIYRAYGLGRNSRREVYGLKILRQYARWAAEGKPVKPPPEDPLQRGGDFVVGRDGRLTLSHTGRNQAERPSVAQILRALSSV